MWDGAEAYVEMRERADGIRAPGCNARRGRIARRGLGKLRLGLDWLTLLRRAGQPQQRTRARSWCVKGGGADVAVLSQAGRVQLAGSTARGRTAGGMRVGARSRRTVIRVRGRYVSFARKGRIRVVAVATRGLARNRRALRVAVRRLRTAKATTAPRVFTPTPAQAAAAGKLTGQTLAGTSDPTLNSALVMLCRLQFSAVSS